MLRQAGLYDDNDRLSLSGASRATFGRHSTSSSANLQPRLGSSSSLSLPGAGERGNRSGFRDGRQQPPRRRDDWTTIDTGSELADCESGYGETVLSLSTEFGDFSGASTARSAVVDPSDPSVLRRSWPTGAALAEHDGVGASAASQRIADNDSTSSRTESDEVRVMQAILEADSALRRQQQLDMESTDGTSVSQRTITVEHPVKVKVVGNENTAAIHKASSAAGGTPFPPTVGGLEMDASAAAHRQMTRINVIFDDGDDRENHDGEYAGDDSVFAASMSSRCRTDANGNETNDDDDLLMQRLDDGRLLVDSASGEVLWSPNNAADHLERSSAGKYEIEVIEHQATRTSTVLVPNTAIDSSSSSTESLPDDERRSEVNGEDEKSKSLLGRRTAATSEKDSRSRLSNTMTKTGTVSRRSSRAAVLSDTDDDGHDQTVRSAMSTVTRELGTQTIQDCSTQTDVEQSTQTSPSRSTDRLDGYDLRTTAGRSPTFLVDDRDMNRSYDAARLGQTGDRGRSSSPGFGRRFDSGAGGLVTSRSVDFQRQFLDQHGWPIDQQDFAQQTPAHNATQTPIRIRLGTSSAARDAGAQLLNHYSVGELGESVLALGTPYLPVENAWNAGSFVAGGSGATRMAESRNFGTQTFGQLTGNLTADSETQTALNGRMRTFPSTADSAGGFDSCSERTSSVRHRRHGERSSHGAGSSSSKRHSHSSTAARSSKHKHRRKTGGEANDDESVDESRRSQRDPDAESSVVGRSSVQGTDPGRKELIKLMLHEIRALKEKAASSIAGDTVNGDRTGKKSTERHLHQQPQRLDVDGRSASNTRKEKHGKHRYESSTSRHEARRLPQHGYGDRLAVNQRGPFDVGVDRSAARHRRTPRRHSIESYLSQRRSSPSPVRAGGVEWPTDQRVSRRQLESFNCFHPDAFPVRPRRAVTAPPYTRLRHPSESFHRRAMYGEQRFPIDNMQAVNSGRRLPAIPPQQQQQLGFIPGMAAAAPNFTSVAQPIVNASSPIIFVPEVQITPAAETAVAAASTVPAPSSFVLIAGTPNLTTGVATPAPASHPAPMPTSAVPPDSSHRRSDGSRHRHHHKHRQSDRHSHSHRNGDDQTATSSEKRRHRRKSTSAERSTDGGVSGDIELSLSQAEREAKTMKRLTASIRKRSPQPNS